MNAGRSAEAEPVIRRALAIDEKAFGRDNPTTAFDLQILAGVLLQQSLKNNQPPAQGKRVLLTGQLPGILTQGRAARARRLAAPALDLSSRGQALDGAARRRGERPRRRASDVETGGGAASRAAAIRNGGRWRAARRSSGQARSARARGPLAECGHLRRRRPRLRADADIGFALCRGSGIPSRPLRLHCFGQCLADRADNRSRRPGLLAGMDRRGRGLFPSVHRRLGHRASRAAKPSLGIRRRGCGC